MDIRSYSESTGSMIPLSSMIPGSSMIPSESMLKPREITPQEQQQASPLGFLLKDTTGSRSSAPAHLEPIIQQTAKRYNLPAGLLKGLIEQESNWNPKAVSPTGAKGLVQFTSQTLDELNRKGNPIWAPTKVNPWDPNSAIPAMGAYLSYILKLNKGHIPSALTGYNAGPYKRRKDYNRENREYAEKVLRRAVKYGFTLPEAM